MRRRRRADLRSVGWRERDRCHGDRIDDCTFTVDPPSIAVPTGTAFTVQWVSAGASDIEFDVSKIDQFNAVPIILGLEPGGSYHDDIREWCGDLFTGTFDFELRSCFDPTYIPVDCGADA